MTELVVGDAFGSEPATASRFVLPFAYSLEPVPSPEGTAWVPDESLTADRRLYYTAQTYEALYDRTRWFHLQEVSAAEPSPETRTVSAGKAPESKLGDFKWAFSFPGSKGDLSVSIGQQRLVLFEFETAAREPRRPQSREDPLQLLHTGFLILDATFSCVDGAPLRLDDLLRFNELFRYYREPWTGHFALEMQKYLGDHLGSQGSDSYVDRWREWLDLPIRFDGSAFQLGLVDPADLPRDDPPESWLCYADNRAFVWTCAVVEGGARAFGIDEDSYQKSRYWVRLLNVDSPGKEEPTAFERAWVLPRTYTRWLLPAGSPDSPSIYGFNYHAGAAILPPGRGPDLWRHFLTLYFDQALMLFYLRVTAFRFSFKLSRASREWVDQDNPAVPADDLEALRKAYTLLTNDYRFPLISNQQQAVEIYEKLRQAFDVEDLLNEVNQQIETSHELLETSRSKEHMRVATALSLAGATGLALALAIALLDLDWIADGFRNGEPSWLGVRDWFLIAATTGGFAALVFFFLNWAESKGGLLARTGRPRRGRWRGWAIGALLATALFAALFHLVRMLMP